MKLLIFKLSKYIAEENRFGYRTWHELPSHMLSTAAYLKEQGISSDVVNLFPGEEIDFTKYDIAIEWVSIADGLYEGLFWLSRAKVAGCRTVLLLFDNWVGQQRQILEDYPDIDFAVNGIDREIVLARLIETLERGDTTRDLSGLVCRENGNVIDHGLAPASPNLNHLVSYRSIIEEFSLPLYGAFFMRAACGCPFPCTFCHVGGRRIRFRSVDALVDEISVLPQNAHLRIGATDMLLDPEWTAMFCETLLSRGIKNTWETDVRVDSLKDAALLRLMCRAGCKELALGIESLHPDILKAVRKGLSLDKIDAGIHAALAAGIVPSINMMLGHPLDSDETLDVTLVRLKELLRRGAKLVGFQYLRPLPGTRIEQECMDAGLLRESLSYRFWFSCRNEPVVPTKYLDKKQLIEWFTRINREVAEMNPMSAPEVDIPAPCGRRGILSHGRSIIEETKSTIRRQRHKAGSLLRCMKGEVRKAELSTQEIGIGPGDPQKMMGRSGKDVISIGPHNLNIYQYVLKRVTDSGIHILTSKDFFNNTYDPSTLNVLLRHDIDFRPETTDAMISIEEKLGIRSDIYVILDDAYYDILPYVEYFRDLHRKGFIIGLHTVAPGNDDYFRVFDSEVKRFKQLFGFDAEYFTIHGKSPSPDNWQTMRQNFLDGIRDYLKAFSIKGSHNFGSPELWIEDSGANLCEFSLLRREFIDLPMFYKTGVVGVLMHPLHWIKHTAAWPTEESKSSEQLFDAVLGKN